MAPRPKKGEVSFSGTSVKARFQEALGSLGLEDYQVLRGDVQEQFVPSGSIIWDEVCRLKGIPHRGRVILLHGREHSGKSTLGYLMLAAHQRETGEPAVIFDYERTCSLEYLQSLGVDISPDMLLVARPNNLQQGIQHALKLMKAGVRYFMWDSIPRMKAQVDEKAILSGDAFKAAQPGAHAKALAQFFDHLLPYMAEHDAIFVMVNQHQARIDASQEAQMAQKYPSMTNLPYILPGGYAPRYVASVSVEVNIAKAYRAGGADDDFWFEGTDDAKGDFIANKVKVRVLKNKATSGGFREATIWIRPGRGVDDWISVRELARHYELITAVGRKWVVGNPESPVATYDNKQAALEALVDKPDYEVLGKLRELVVQAIREDVDGFAAELTDAEKRAFSDSIDLTGGGDSVTTKFALLGDDEIDLS